MSTSYMTSIRVQETIEEQRRKIDEEVEQLQKRIQELRSARNRPAPTYHALVPEILASIFLLARDASESPHGYMPLVISWVCRDWRQIALAYPALWSNIESTNLMWVQEFIERSRNSPLTIVLGHQKPRNIFLPLFLPLLPQMISFTIQDVADVYSRPGAAQAGESNVPAPLLEDLDLTRINLSKPMFSLGLPRLQNLSLSYCFPGWSDSLILPSLVSLSIRCPDGRISVRAVVRILGNLPNMESLLLEGAMKMGVLHPDDPSAQVHLQNLQCLILKSEHCLTAISLSQSVLIPTRARVSLCLLWNERNQVTDSAKALRNCREGNSKPWRLSHLELCCSAFRHCLWLEETSLDGEITTLMLGFNCPLPDGDHTFQVLQSLSDMSSLPSLEFRAEPGVRLPSSLWPDGFAYLPNLHTLTIRDGGVPSFLRRLEAEARHLLQALNSVNAAAGLPIVEDSGNASPSLRALRKLVLQGSSPSEVQRLPETLDARQRWVGRLQELVLLGSQLPNEVLDLFANRVEKIVCEPPPSILRAEGDNSW